jgi:uncharacterized protein (TIGR00661 family)
MARILYGVMGDSRGHLSRSLAVAQAMPRHEYLFVGGGTVHELAEAGYSVENVPMASTIRRNNRVHLRATLANAARVFALRGPVVKRIAEIIKSFDPHLILTDYEFFTPLAAAALGRPAVSLDHQHILTHCTYQPPPGQHLNRFLTCSAIRQFYSAADRFFIVSFYPLPPTDDSKTEVFAPIVRAIVKEIVPTTGDHVLVYFADGAFHSLLPVLEARKVKCIIYGLGEQPPTKNLVFKSESIHGFLEDLASCRYVISNAGHSLISEALYYAKPVLAFPRSFEYEQLLNAYFLSKHGLGGYGLSLAAAERILGIFEQRLEGYRAGMEAHRIFGYQRLVHRLEGLMGHDLDGDGTPARDGQEAPWAYS